MPPTETPTQPRKKKPTLQELAAQGVRDSMARPAGMPGLEVSPASQPGVRAKIQLDRSVGLLPLEHIRPDANQPRKVDTTGEDFRDLVASVREHGVMQPITVRYLADADRFQIVSGERRYRAAAAAGLKEIHAVVIDPDDAQTKIRQIEENLHRRNLNPIEEAAAIRWLMDTNGYAQQEVAERIHKSKAYVSEILAIDERLSRQEKTKLSQVRTSELPGKSLIYAALRASDPETRSAILFGKLDGKKVTVAGARAAIADNKRKHAGRPKAYVRSIELAKLGASVTIRFPKKARVPVEAVIDALDAALAQVKAERRG